MSAAGELVVRFAVWCILIGMVGDASGTIICGATYLRSNDGSRCGRSWSPRCTVKVSWDLDTLIGLEQGPIGLGHPNMRTRRRWKIRTLYQFGVEIKSRLLPLETQDTILMSHIRYTCMLLDSTHLVPIHPRSPFMYTRTGGDLSSHIKNSLHQTFILYHHLSALDNPYHVCN
jgi:hypothetical protein